MTAIVNFLDASLAFDLAPAEALAFFQAKGLKPTFAWQDMLGDEHDVAFTVAKMMDTDLLTTVRTKVEQAIATGSSLSDFRRDLIPTLQASGWWGKKDVVDPLTGNVVKAQLGSASRLETIFRTNIQSAYAAGHWEQIDENADDAPWLLYDAVDDFRTRPEHAAMDGTLLPVTDPWWQTHYPPNGWNCRCGVIQLSDAEVEQMGLTKKPPPNVPTKVWMNPRTGHTHIVPGDLDPGWDHNAGVARVAQIKALALEKAKALQDIAAQAALAEAAVLQEQANAAYRAELKAAQAELDLHAAQNTPYLANAIKQVQASKAAAAMNPKQVLAAAKEKALATQQAALVADYKAALIKGKKPSPKAVEAFDALPQAKQQAILDDILAKKGDAATVETLDALDKGTGNEYLVGAYEQLATEGKLASLTPKAKLDLVKATADAKAQETMVELVIKYPPGSAGAQAMLAAVKDLPFGAPNWERIVVLQNAVKAYEAQVTAEAQATLQAMAAGTHAPQAKIKQSILQKLKANQYAQTVTPAELVAEVTKQATEQQAKADAAAFLSGYKKKVLAGKIPSPKEKAAFDALTPAKQTEFLAKIEKAKPKPAAPPPSPPPAAPSPAKLPPDVPSPIIFDSLAPTQQAEAHLYLMAAMEGKKKLTPLLKKELAWFEKLPAGQKPGAIDSWLENLSSQTGWSPEVLKSAAYKAWKSEEIDLDAIETALKAQAEAGGGADWGGAAWLAKNVQADLTDYEKFKALMKHNQSGIADEDLAGVWESVPTEGKASFLKGVVNGFKQQGLDVDQVLADALLAKQAKLAAAKPAPGIAAVPELTIKQKYEILVKEIDASQLDEAMQEFELASEAQKQILLNNLVAEVKLQGFGTDAEIQSLWAKAAAAAAEPPNLLDLTTAQKYKALIDEILPEDDALSAMGEFEAASPAGQEQLLEDLIGHLKEEGEMTDAELAEMYAKAYGIPEAAPTGAALHPSAVASPEPLTMANMVKTGQQAGTNAGGFYQDTTTGTRYYIKQPATEDIARNEWLASKLYEAAGVEVPKLTVWKEKGTTYLASEIIDGITENKAMLQSGIDASTQGGLDAFVVDAWLGNWDVVGVDLTNTVFKGNRAIRIDVGGALRYRAQGGMKGAQWNTKVDDLESIRDPKFNAQGARAFNKITRDDMIAGARKVLAVTDRQIDDLVDNFGPVDLAAKAELKATLKARRERIRELFPEADVKVVPKALPNTIDVTPSELEAIKASRVNGYTRAGDADKIEDHQVRIHHYTDTKGKKRTRITLKIRDTDHLKGVIGKASRADDGRRSVDLASAQVATEKIVKNLAYQTAHGHTFTALNLSRLNLAIGELDTAIKELDAIKSSLGFPANVAADAAAKRATLVSAKAELEWMLGQYTEGAAVPAWRTTIPIADIQGTLTSKAAGSKAEAGLSFTRVEKPKYSAATYNASNQTLTTGKIGYQNAVAYDATRDGVTVRVFGPESGYYIRGQVELDVAGDTTDAATKALAVLRDDLGIDTAPTTDADRLEVWLDQTAWHRLQLNPRGTRSSKFGPYKALASITDQEKRIAEKLKMLNKDAGFDLTKTATYQNREGVQAFGHGRRLLLRADYDNDPSYTRWADTHLLYHSVGTLSKSGSDRYGYWASHMVPIFEGGGTLSSLLERTRRGLPITSQAGSKDFSHGGAAYVFTRIKKRGATGAWTDNDVGLYWKPHNHMKRLDRSARTTDHYGDVTTVEPHRTDRIDTPAEFTSAAREGSDETIFKDGLSVFDDLDHITVYNQQERREAIKWLQDHGYETWPDGRSLQEVIRAKH